MPRPKALKDYPKAYFQMIEDAQQEPVPVHFESYERARLVRNSWYIFRSVLQEEARENDAYARLAALSEKISINLSTHDEGATLLFTYYDPEHDEISEEIVRRRMGK